MLKLLLLLIFCKICNSNINDNSLIYPPNLINPNADFDEFQLKYLNKNIILYLDFGNNLLHEETINLFYHYGKIINECGIYTYFIQCKFNYDLYTSSYGAPQLAVPQPPADIFYNNQLSPILQNVCERHKHNGYYTYDKNGNVIRGPINKNSQYNLKVIKNLTDRFNCSKETFILKSKLYELENYNKYLNASLNNKNSSVIYINNYNFYNNYLQFLLIIILLFNFCCHFNNYNVNF